MLNSAATREMAAPSAEYKRFWKTWICFSQSFWKKNIVMEKLQLVPRSTKNYYFPIVQNFNPRIIVFLCYFLEKCKVYTPRIKEISFMD
jgi:hypothetical protein